MDFKVIRVSPEEWKEYAEVTHRVVFNKEKPSHWDRLDYVLLIVNPVSNLAVGYMTCREVTHEMVYWQYGGAFPNVKGTLYSWPAYQKLVHWHKGRYKFVTTYIENTNLPMMKMAMKVGFRVIGCRTVDGSILLEHFLKLEDIDGLQATPETAS